MTNFNEMSNEELSAVLKEVQNIVELRKDNQFAIVDRNIRKTTRLERELDRGNDIYIDEEIRNCEIEIENAYAQVNILRSVT